MLELCAALSCAHLGGLEHDACVLQCMKVGGREFRGHDSRRTLDDINSCSEARCPGSPQDLDCVYIHCIPHSLVPHSSSKLLTARDDEYKGVQGIYGVLKRGGTYGNVKDEKRAPSLNGYLGGGIHKVATRTWGEPYLMCLESQCSQYEDDPTGSQYNRCASICRMNG